MPITNPVNQSQGQFLTLSTAFKQPTSQSAASGEGQTPRWGVFIVEGDVDNIETRMRVADCYEQGVEELTSLLQGDKDDRFCVVLNEFLKMVKVGIEHNYSSEVREKFMGACLIDFYQFCTLAQGSNLPEAMRLDLVREFATSDLLACGPGVQQRIETASRKIRAYAAGLPELFKHTYKELIQQVIRQTMGYDRVGIEAGNEIHEVAAYFDSLAADYGLEKIDDSFAKGMAISSELMEGMRASVQAQATPERVIEHMASDCLEKVRQHCRVAEQESPEADVYQVLKTAFDGGDKRFAAVELSDVLFEGDAIGQVLIHTDSTLVARRYARALRDTGALNPFKAVNLLGATATGTKLKLIGERIVYVSERGAVPKGSESEITILDHFIHENHERGQQLLVDLEAQVTAEIPGAGEIAMKHWPVLLESRLTALQQATSTTQVTDELRAIADILAFKPLLFDSFGPAVLRAVDKYAQLNETDAARPLVDRLFNGVGATLEQLFAESVGLSLIHAAQLLLSPALVATEKIGSDVKAAQLEHIMTLLKTDQSPHLEKLGVMLIGALDQTTLAKPRDDDWTFLMLASQNGQTAIVKALAQRLTPEQISHQSSAHYGATALLLAIFFGRVETAQALIDLITRPDDLAIPDTTGCTALGFAALRGQTSILKALAQRLTPEQISQRIPSYNGRTSLMVAIRNGHVETAQAVIDHTTRPDDLAIADDSGSTALTYASKLGQTSIVKALESRLKRVQISPRRPKTA